MTSQSALQIRIDLAFRRLQIALLRSGYRFEGTELESAVTAAAQIVERRVNDDDRLPACDDEGREHWWTEWRSNPFNALCEERFCFECGSMETQTIGPSGGGA